MKQLFIAKLVCLVGVFYFALSVQLYSYQGSYEDLQADIIANVNDLTQIEPYLNSEFTSVQEFENFLVNHSVSIDDFISFLRSLYFANAYQGTLDDLTEYLISNYTTREDMFDYLNSEFVDFSYFLSSQSSSDIDFFGFLDSGFLVSGDNPYSEGALFYFPFVDFNMTQDNFSDYTESLSELNAFLDSSFPSLAPLSVTPVQDLTISNKYKTTIFSSNISDNLGDVWFLVNYSNFGNIIVSAIKFYPYISVPDGGSDRTLVTLLDVNATDVFYFENNSISRYTVNVYGRFTHDQTYVVNDNWDFSFIKDYFPTLRSLYLNLSYNYASNLSEFNTLINNLSLKVFGIADYFKFEIDSFSSYLKDNCSDLKIVFLGFNDTYGLVNDLDSSCPSIEHAIYPVLSNSDISDVYGAYNRLELESIGVDLFVNKIYYYDISAY